MALPNQLKSSRLTDATRAYDIDNHIRDIELAICDILGLPIDTNISVKLFDAAAGGLRKVLFTVSAAPAAAGEMARNGKILQLHDGDAVKHVFTGSVIRKTADESLVSSTAFQNDDQLSIPIAASEVLSVRASVLFAAPQFVGMKMALGTPSGATGCVAMRQQINYTEEYIYFDLSLGDNNYALFSTTSVAFFQWAELFATVVNGANPGNVTLRWAQNGSNAGALTVKAGSVIESKRIS